MGGSISYSVTATPQLNFWEGWIAVLPFSHLDRPTYRGGLLMREFEEAWRRLYPVTEPVGWTMRRAHGHHWVRFHSLPLSKRYAETDEERQTLLVRSNELERDDIRLKRSRS